MNGSTEMERQTWVLAQHMYDAREETGLISGSDLHEIFGSIGGGDMSPPGRQRYLASHLARLASEYRSQAASLRPAVAEHLLDKARFCEFFASDVYASAVFRRGDQQMKRLYVFHLGC